MMPVYELLAFVAILLTCSNICESSFQTNSGNNLFTKFDFKLLSAKIEEISPDINGYTATLKVPKNTKFSCGTQYITMPVQKERINSNSSPILLEKDGNTEVTCYRNEMADPEHFGYVLMRSELEDGTTVNILFNTSYGKGKYIFQNLNVLYRPISRTKSNGICQSKMAFKWESQKKLKEEYATSAVNLFYINGSQTLAKDVFIGENSRPDIKGASMKITRFPILKEQVVTFNLPESVAEGIQGTSMINIEYRYASSPVESIHFWTLQNKDNSCVPQLKQNSVGISSWHRKRMKEGLIGSVECIAMGNPVPIIALFKERKNGERERIDSITYHYSGSLTAAFKFWDSTSKTASGKYICEATSGTKVIQSDFKLTVMPIYWVKDETKRINKSGHIVTVQLKVESNGPLILRCYSNRIYGHLIFQENDKKPVYNGNVSTFVNATHVSKRSTRQTASLQDTSPIVVSYLPVEERVNEKTIKVVILKLDLSKTESPQSVIICGAHEIPNINRYTDWIKVAI